ncbi:MAG: AAA family ATPase [Planctomycetota bacterium]|jgi:predicted ATPase
MSDPENEGESGAAKKISPFLRRVKIRNYKSIAACAVELRALNVLVGRNGAGKSNFLDALRIVADALQTSLDHAIRNRGGIDAVRRRSTGHPRNLAIELEIELSRWETAKYGFEIASKPKGAFSVKTERLRIDPSGREGIAEYHVESGIIKRPAGESMPPVSEDRLYLVNAAGLPRFREVYDALSAMGFYNLNPEAMKELQSPDAGELLHRDGGNVASVIARLGDDRPLVKERIKDYLEFIVPGITNVHRVPLGHKETLEFRQEVVGSKHPWKFHAGSISDGTLRALGALVAVTQLAGKESPVRLVGIEEPETALHPAAAGALMDALREAASHTQIVVTTHSADLLDQVNAEAEQLLAVQSKQGTTEIAPVNEANREAIRTHLFTPGELLRMDQLAPDEKAVKGQEQLRLFEDDEGAL